MNPKMTIEDALKLSRTIKSETPLLDAQVLLCEAVGLSKVGLYIQNKRVLTDEEYQKYISGIERRQKNEPIAYITGHCEFMGLDFDLNYDTLIPRPDTEIVTQAVIDAVKDKKYKTVLDMCTGSGAIAVSIGHYCRISVSASDISKNALDKARHNARKNSVDADFIESDLFENISGKYDVIVSNPPYIRTDVIETLLPNVKDYEPLSALDGGDDGLYFYRGIAEGAREHINDGGMLFFEIGYDQADDAAEIMEENGFKNIKLLKDYSGLDRVLYAEK